MAGPYNGAWKATRPNTDYGSPLKWGTGVNPIHSIINTGGGRDTTPGVALNEVPAELTDPYSPLAMGYTPEDSESQIWGYGVSTGTSERPSLGDNTDEFRDNVTENWPSYGPRKGGQPGGRGIRSENRGANVTITGKQIPDENATQGQVYKHTTVVNDSDISDSSQYIMQTSMVQRDKVRAGSQNSGTSNEYNAPIASRQGPMKMPSYSDGQRHYDMQPKSQDVVIRPFWNRTAGTGDQRQMVHNALYESTPYQRTPPGDPYQGPTVPYTTIGANEYGYATEDVIY